jgi:hypothetical protein
MRRHPLSRHLPLGPHARRPGRPHREAASTARRRTDPCDGKVSTRCPSLGRRPEPAAPPAPGRSTVRLRQWDREKKGRRKWEDKRMKMRGTGSWWKSMLPYTVLMCFWAWDKYSIIVVYIIYHPFKKERKVALIWSISVTVFLLFSPNFLVRFICKPYLCLP